MANIYDPENCPIIMLWLSEDCNSDPAVLPTVNIMYIHERPWSNSMKSHDQTAQTQIRLLLVEQSDLRFRCLSLKPYIK